jgi:hypothetical protein
VVRVDDPPHHLTLLFAADGHLCGAALMDDTDLELG